MNHPVMHFAYTASMLFSLAFSGTAAAEMPARPTRAGFTDDVQKAFSDVVDEGQWDVYLSGYAHHSRDTYDDKRVRRLNENAWGGGFGKTRRNSRGNDESVYALVVRDSNENLQWSAGYAYQWIFPVAGSGLEVGAGISTLLISRKDWFDRIPFPAILPVFSIGSQDVKLTVTYVPRISTKRGKGDVTLFVLKTSF